MNELSTQRLAQHLQRITPFSPADLQTVLAAFEPKKVKKGHFLMVEGLVLKHTHFITQGALKAFHEDAQGKEHIIQLAIEDWWMGDMESFVYQTPTRFSVMAVEDTEALRISKEKLDALYLEVPTMERYFRMVMQSAYVATLQRTLNNLTLDAEERYVQFIKRYPMFEQRFPQKVIASYLGFSPEFLSKIKKRRLKKV